MWKDVTTVRSLTVLRFYVNVKELDNSFHIKYLYVKTVFK